MSKGVLKYKQIDENSFLDNLPSREEFLADEGRLDKDYNAKDISLSGDILPNTNGVQNIGSASNRFKAIFVDEAYLSTNTLYIGDTPIIGTDADTIMIESDLDQSINIKTTGVGRTTLNSESGVLLNTTGINADIEVQASGVGARFLIDANAEIKFTAPEVNIMGDMDVSGSLATGDFTVRGNLNVLGSTTEVNSTTVTTADNIIELNKGQVGSGVTAGQAGLKIDRGDAPDYLIVFDEVEDMFQVGMAGNLETIASQTFVNNSITVEETARIAADALLQTAVSSEETARIAAINAEASTRADAILNLQTAISNEATLRESAITDVTNVIDTLPTTYTDTATIAIASDGLINLGLACPADKMVKLLGISVDGVTHWDTGYVNGIKEVIWDGIFGLKTTHKVVVIFNRIS